MLLSMLTRQCIAVQLAGGTEMDKALCKSTGGNQSQGPIYNIKVWSQCSKLCHADEMLLQCMQMALLSNTQTCHSMRRAPVESR